MDLHYWPPTAHPSQFSDNNPLPSTSDYVGNSNGFSWWQSILGADFLKHFNLLVDLKRKQLIDATTHLQVKGMITPRRQPPLHPIWNISANHNNNSCMYRSILTSFPSLIRFSTFNDTPITHDLTHRITTVGQPVHAKPCRLPPPNTSR